MTLAIASYNRIPSLGDSADILSLAWTSDERELLDLNLDGLISDVTSLDVSQQASLVGRYHVKDPYGENAIKDAVADHFRVERSSIGVVCTAGVNSALYCLAHLRPTCAATIVGEIYPDFPHWLGQLGRQANSWDDGSTICAPKLIFLERPSFVRAVLTDLDQLHELCLRRVDPASIVIVDESNANYLPRELSAITIVPSCPNLIVVRGFSKAYGLGGIRLGYCVTHCSFADTIKSVVPPLMASSLSIEIGRRILLSGDICGGLREAIRRNKATAKASLAAAGVIELDCCSEPLPYLLVGHDDSVSRSTLNSCGIVGKSHTLWSPEQARTRQIYRLSVPLSVERLERFRRQLISRPP